MLAFFLAALVALPGPAQARKQRDAGDPYGVVGSIDHSLSYEAKEKLFDAAAREGRALIALEFPFESLEPAEDEFTTARADETMAMAEQRGLTVVGRLTGTAQWIADARSRDMSRGPIAGDKYGAYRAHVKYLVKRYPRVRYWEVWPLADDRRVFAGSPAEFARLLETAYKAVHSADPRAQVLLPSTSAPPEAAYASGSWLDRVLRDSEHPGHARFDVAAVRLRGPVGDLAASLRAVAAYLAALGRPEAPVWVVDFGFPASQAQQRQLDPAFATGEAGQASYYERAIPILRKAGAAAVLLPLRDLDRTHPACSGAAFPASACSEGLVSSDGRERKALAVLRGL